MKKPLRLKVIGKSRMVTPGGYVYDHNTIQLPENDADIELKFPNGKTMTLQWRVESPSIDVLLPETLPVSNWIGTDMKPAPKFGKHAEVRNADQLMLPLPEDYSVE